MTNQERADEIAGMLNSAYGTTFAVHWEFDRALVTAAGREAFSAPAMALPDRQLCVDLAYLQTLAWLAGAAHAIAHPAPAHMPTEAR